MTEGHNGHGPSLDEMVLKEAERSTILSSQITESIEHAHVPLTKDGKPDIDAFIKHLMHETTAIVKKVVGDDPTYNPAWLPGYELMKSRLETNPNAIKGGHVTLDGKNLLNQLYQSTIDSYIENRRGVAFQAASPEDSKESAIRLADITSNKYLGPVIKASKTAAEVASKIAQTIREQIEKARQWYQTHGKMDGYVLAYAGAPAGHGH